MKEERNKEATFLISAFKVCAGVIVSVFLFSLCFLFFFQIYLAVYSLHNYWWILGKSLEAVYGFQGEEVDKESKLTPYGEKISRGMWWWKYHN